MLSPETLEEIRAAVTKTGGSREIIAKLREQGCSHDDLQEAQRYANTLIMGGHAAPSQAAEELNLQVHSRGGRLVIPLLVIALCIAGGAAWYVRSHAGYTFSPNPSAVVPASWSSYTSLATLPGYSASYPAGWQVSEKKDLTLFRPSDRSVGITVVRELDKSGFDSFYSQTVDASKMSGGPRFIESLATMTTPDGYAEQRYATSRKFENGELFYAMRTEIVAGTTRWSIGMDINDPSSKDLATVKGDEAVYESFVAGFRVNP